VPERERRRNVPSVDGAATRWSSSSAVRPDRSTSQSSIESAPSTIAEISVITFDPALAAPIRRPSPTNRSISAAIPNRAASVAANTTPASETARRSSKATRTRSGPTGPSSCTMR
jgi:hypothetical protein